ncbi:exodeoxyribonuclease V alpha subunit [Vibrio crassostreae]|uniref:AAA family ATPase n=1 Tax=Vibrio crassostreae TaxID=246167 RepID=UPI00119A62F2|nr:AAA family ATPase [Vibrio crassostreae]TWD38691.1 exodeoxyribonuclease V alpha subunit [Vibrio crassostreae]
MTQQFSGDVQIRKIRSKGQKGGVIFSAISVDDKPQRFVVKAGFDIAPNPSMFKEKHFWFVEGTIEVQKITWKDGSTNQESVIKPSKISFIKAANENLKRLLSESKAFKGISSVKADKLVTFFGDRLYQIASENDVERLTPILGKSTAQTLIAGLNEYQALHCLKLLDDLGVPAYIGESVLKIWGSDAYDKIKSNPYILVMFMASLASVDELAINRLNFKIDSPERLIAYTKETLYDAFKAGNTCLPISDLRRKLRRKIGNFTEQALQISQDMKEITVDGQVAQVKSLDIIESGVASMIFELAKSRSNKPVNRSHDKLTKVYEKKVGFALTREQRNAISTCLISKLSVLTGSAGCGKTTVLEAICYSLESLKLTSKIYLMALSGKAAMRITEATGREAMTIAGFMFHENQDDIPDDATFIIDEASMVDILSLYQLLKKLPYNGRIILTGDEEQLPPVGIGLSLHTLVGIQQINNPTLSVVKRQSEESGIPNVANKVRYYPDTKEPIPFIKYRGLGSGVSFVPCPNVDIESESLRLYQELGGIGNNNDVLLLSAIKSGVGGVLNLNALVHDKFANGNTINFTDAEYGKIQHSINGRSLKVGELVMYTKNDYKKDIRNGSIGQVIGTSNDGVIIKFDSKQVLLSASELNHLEHAYALTVHKSQGSQFDRVIVVIKQSRIIDRHLIYTALTRAKHQVVFVGDETVFYEALLISKAFCRHTKLSSFIEAAICA